MPLFELNREVSPKDLEFAIDQFKVEGGRLVRIQEPTTIKGKRIETYSPIEYLGWALDQLGLAIDKGVHDRTWPYRQEVVTTTALQARWRNLEVIGWAASQGRDPFLANKARELRFAIQSAPAAVNGRVA